VVRIFLNACVLSAFKDADIMSIHESALQPTMLTSEMTFSSAFFAVLKRIGYIATIALFAGCANRTRPVGVSSSPPPVVGSAPIIAYDDYAQVVVPLTRAKGKALAVIVPTSDEAPLVVVASPEPQVVYVHGAVGGTF